MAIDDRLVPIKATGCSIKLLSVVSLRLTSLMIVIRSLAIVGTLVHPRLQLRSLCILNTQSHRLRWYVT
jgi:hypothetical protein